MKICGLTFLLLCAAVLMPHASPQSQYPFQNPDLPTEQRVDNILSLMTPDEKIAALSPEQVSELRVSQVSNPRSDVGSRSERAAATGDSNKEHESSGGETVTHR